MQSNDRADNLTRKGYGAEQASKGKTVRDIYLDR
jgi:hypothetical protein